MIANPAICYPAAVPHPFTLNDLRVHSPIAEEPASTSASILTVSSLILAGVLAIGAFIWLDPLHLFTPTEVSPRASALVPSADPARPTERQQIIASLTPVAATKSVDPTRNRTRKGLRVAPLLSNECGLLLTAVERSGWPSFAYATRVRARPHI